MYNEVQSETEGENFKMIVCICLFSVSPSFLRSPRSSRAATSFKDAKITSHVIPTSLTDVNKTMFFLLSQSTLH